MQVTETKSEGLARAYDIVIPAADVAAKVDARLKELAKDIKLPGFRPGKVPVNLVRQRYGKSVLGEVFEASVNESVAQLLKDKDIEPASQPKVDKFEGDEGTDISFSVSVDTLPSVTPMDFSKLALERLKVTAPDSEVEDTLKNLADNAKSSEPAEDGKALEDGDIAVIDFKGEVDGETLPGMEAEDFNLEIGSGSFVPGFEEQLVGAKAGEERTLSITFPEEYGAEKLAGKETTFFVTVKEVRVSVPAAIDDALAERFGMKDLEELKTRIAEDIEKHYGEMAGQVLKRNVLDAMDENHSFDLPQSLVDAEFDGIWKSVSQAKEAGRLSEKEAAKDEDTLKAEYRVIAERRVKLGLVMQQVAKDNKIVLGQDDVNQALMQEMRKYPGQEQEFMNFVRENPGAVQALTAPLLEQKVVDFIAELAGAKEKVITADDLKAEIEKLDNED